MVIAAALSARLGLIDAAYAQRVHDLVERAGLPVRAPDLGRARWFELMRLDKKAEGGEIRFIVIEAPGRAGVRPVPDTIVAEVIAEHVA
jgi:3-dehydroquinate synthase